MAIAVDELELLGAGVDLVDELAPLELLAAVAGVDELLEQLAGTDSARA